MRRRAGLIVAAVVLVGLAVAPAVADPNTKSVRGTFEEQAVSGPACTSPVGLCAAGRFRGGLHGPFDIVVAGTTPTSNPDVIVLDTASVLHTRTGDLSFSGLTLYNTATGYFSSVDEVSGGTGAWAGASGTLQSAGRFTVEEGGSGRFQAVITTA